MSTTKKIGILTSGGDCAGLNAVIRAVVNSASRLGWEVYGIKNGTDGLTEKPLAYEILTVHNFSDTPWPRISGSYLGSLNKGVKMESLEEVSKRFGEGVKTLGLDAIVVVGGDGSRWSAFRRPLTTTRRLPNFQSVSTPPVRSALRPSTAWTLQPVPTPAL